MKTETKNIWINIKDGDESQSHLEVQKLRIKDLSIHVMGHVTDSQNRLRAAAKVAFLSDRIQDFLNGHDPRTELILTKASLAASTDEKKQSNFNRKAQNWGRFLAGLLVGAVLTLINTGKI